MKKLILMTLTFAALAAAPSLSFAKKAKSAKIPVYRDTFSVSAYKSRFAKEECIDELSKKLSEIEGKLANVDFSELIQGDPQYACKKIEVRIQGSSHRYSNGDGDDLLKLTTLGLFGWSTTSTEKNVALEVFCIQRSMREKQIFSFARRCEENPAPECFDEKMLDMMDSLEPTEYAYIGKDNACK